MSELEEDVKKENVQEEVKVKEEAPSKVRKNHNECLGRSAEYLLCKLYFHPNVDAIFKQELIDLTLLEKDLPLFEKIKDYYPYLEYIGNVDHKYDFKYCDVNNHQQVKYVSLKTNFTGYKVCPQVIGQTTLKKYRHYFDLDESYDIVELKKYILTHISDLLQAYMKNTFHCDILYYMKAKGRGKEKKSKIQIIPYDIDALSSTIHLFDTHKISFSHIVKNKEWNESTTVYYTDNDGIRYSIGEFQIHHHRDNIKFRWIFPTLIEILKIKYIEITHSI